MNRKIVLVSLLSVFAGAASANMMVHDPFGWVQYGRCRSCQLRQLGRAAVSYPRLNPWACRNTSRADQAKKAN
jgi:hypothetical protein